MATLAFNHEEIAARELRPELLELDGISRALHRGLLQQPRLGRDQRLGVEVPDRIVDSPAGDGSVAYLLIPLGYVLGSMPWGYWLPRLPAGIDVRTVGSGNVGGTNVWRTLGWKYGLPVALLDLGKGLAAALLGRWLGNDLVGVLAG